MIASLKISFIEVMQIIAIHGISMGISVFIAWWLFVMLRWIEYFSSLV